MFESFGRLYKFKMKKGRSTVLLIIGQKLYITYIYNEHSIYTYIYKYNYYKYLYQLPTVAIFGTFFSNVNRYDNERLEKYFCTCLFPQLFLYINFNL